MSPKNGSTRIIALESAPGQASVATSGEYWAEVVTLKSIFAPALQDILEVIRVISSTIRRAEFVAWHARVTAALSLLNGGSSHPFGIRYLYRFASHLRDMCQGFNVMHPERLFNLARVDVDIYDIANEISKQCKPTFRQLNNEKAKYERVLGNATEAGHALHAAARSLTAIVEVSNTNLVVEASSEGRVELVNSMVSSERSSAQLPMVSNGSDAPRSETTINKSSCSSSSSSSSGRPSNSSSSSCSRSELAAISSEMGLSTSIQIIPGDIPEPVDDASTSVQNPLEHIANMNDSIQPAVEISNIVIVAEQEELYELAAQTILNSLSLADIRKHVQALDRNKVKHGYNKCECPMCGTFNFKFRRTESSFPRKHHENSVRSLRHTYNYRRSHEYRIKCNKCGHRVHKVCALFNPKIDGLSESVYHCPKCLIRMVDNRNIVYNAPAIEATASSLPHYPCSKFVERFVHNAEGKVRWQLAVKKQKHLLRRGFRFKVYPEASFNDEPQDIGQLYVRLVGSKDKWTKPSPTIFGAEQEIGVHPTLLPYSEKGLALFQKQDGIDVMLFVFYLHVYGSNCAASNTRCMYISYADSVPYCEPRQLRTPVFQAMINGSIAYFRTQGITLSFLWSCPPANEYDRDYIFAGHPSSQLVPTPQHLRNWYLRLFVAGIKDGALVKYSNMLVDYFAYGPPDPKQLPYFESDLWTVDAIPFATKLTENLEGLKQLPFFEDDGKLMSQRVQEIFFQESDLHQDLFDDCIVVHMHHTCSECNCALDKPNMFYWTPKLTVEQPTNRAPLILCDYCFIMDHMEAPAAYPANERPCELNEMVRINTTHTRDDDGLIPNGVMNSNKDLLFFCYMNNLTFDTRARDKHATRNILHSLHHVRACVVATAASDEHVGMNNTDVSQPLPLGNQPTAADQGSDEQPLDFSTELLIGEEPAVDTGVLVAEQDQLDGDIVVSTQTAHESDRATTEEIISIPLLTRREREGEADNEEEQYDDEADEQTRGCFPELGSWFKHNTRYVWKSAVHIVTAVKTRLTERNNNNNNNNNNKNENKSKNKNENKNKYKNKNKNDKIKNNKKKKSKNKFV